MIKHPVRGCLFALATVVILHGCSSHSGSPTDPHFQRSVRAAQVECGEGAFLSALSPVLAVWEDSIEVWRANTDLLNTPPAWTDGSSTASYLSALVPVLQQWHGAINGALGSAVLDSVATFDAGGNHQDYLTGLSALLAGWETALEANRGRDFLPTAPVFQRDTMAPVIACLADTTIDCADSLGVALEFEPSVTDDCDPAPHVTSDPPSGTVFPPGETMVTWTATDSSGNSATCSFKVTVNAAVPPVLTSLHASPSTLWPPNHKWVDVKVTPHIDTGCDNEAHWSIVDVTSNEPDNGTGDGNTSPDWMITGDHGLKLRAERSGNGDGRVYTVTVRVEDGSGNGDESTVRVVVPHDHGHGH